MCFSPGASFSVGATLIIIGVATIKKTQRRTQLLFASIPLIFGIQQIAEGILWVTLSNIEYETTQKTFTYIYLFFAQIVWPIWVPIAILQLSTNTDKKNIQKLFAAVGITIGAYMAYCLIAFQVEARIVGKHIMYIQNYPTALKPFVIIFYALATIVAPLFSRIKNMWIIGITVLLSYIITAIFYNHYVVSVWCFFSSLISLSIYAIIHQEKKRSLRTNV